MNNIIRSLPKILSVFVFVSVLSVSRPAAFEPPGCLWGLFQSNTPVSLESINETEIR